jgi:hypothetical protein
MRASVAIILLTMFCINGSSGPMFANHPVPKDRSALTGGEWFPHVLSKLAPLEWWSYQESNADVKREDYASDWRFQLARQNTWEFPLFCFSLFRPSNESFTALLRAVEEYQGAVVWQMHDDCIGAWPSKGGFIKRIPGTEEKKLEDSVRNPPQADPAFVKKAVADIPVFCAYLEQRLGLQERITTDFDPRWLTREGLAQSRGEFEEFIEPGSWTVFLARDPNTYAKTFQPTSSADRSLSIGIGMFQCDELLKELGAKWNDAAQLLALPEFPLLSRFPDIASDAVYLPDEIDPLLTELLRAQRRVRKSQSIRGLDNLIRIARWAAELKVGIYFGGQ